LQPGERAVEFGHPARVDGPRPRQASAVQPLAPLSRTEALAKADEGGASGEADFMVGRYADDPPGVIRLRVADRGADRLHQQRCVVRAVVAAVVLVDGGDQRAARAEYPGGLGQRSRGVLEAQQVQQPHHRHRVR